MGQYGKVLIVDTDPAEADYFVHHIKKCGFQCVSTNCSNDVLKLIASERPNIVVTHIDIAKEESVNNVKEIKRFDSNIILILLSSNESNVSPAAAFRFGAHECLKKPVSQEQLEAAIFRAVQQKLSNVERNLMIYEKLEGLISRFVREKERAVRDCASQGHVDDNLKFDNMIGKSTIMRDIFQKILKISKSNANVMIYGESGTGKELIARSIHNNSRRRTRSLIPVDCVALPENLLESELFGFEKGAFTGAVSMRKGLLEYADLGTLFLDEIVELAPNLQAKLLRVLQEGEFRRVGGNELIKVDLRIISATNIEPSQAVESGKLREDLYYRLNVIPLELPPLRERKEDIPILAEFFVRKICAHSTIERKTVSQDAIEVLKGYSWPGNVRELQNVMERLVSLTESSIIRLADLPDYMVSSHKSPYTKDEALNLPLMQARKLEREKFEKVYLINLLKKCNGNISKGAQLAQVSRRTMYRMINMYDLQEYV